MPGNLERRASCPADRPCSTASADSPLGTLGLVAFVAGAGLGVYAYVSKGKRELGLPALGVAALGGLIYLANRPADEGKCVACPFDEAEAKAELERVAGIVRTSCEPVSAKTDATVGFSPETGEARVVDVGNGSQCIAKAFINNARVRPYAPPQRSATIELLGAKNA